MNKSREVFIDQSCIICSSFGKRIQKHSRNVKVTSNDNLDEDLYSLDSIIYKRGDNILVGIDAIVELVSEWGGYYRLIIALKILPKSLNKFIYSFIARNRHKIYKIRNSNGV